MPLVCVVQLLVHLPVFPVLHELGLLLVGRLLPLEVLFVLLREQQRDECDARGELLVLECTVGFKKKKKKKKRT